jgi:hypothetical protein
LRLTYGFPFDFSDTPVADWPKKGGQLPTNFQRNFLNASATLSFLLRIGRQLGLV